MNNVLTHKEQITGFDKLVNEARECLANIKEAEIQNTPAYIVLKISKDANSVTVEAINCFASDEDMSYALRHFANHFGIAI